MPRYFPAAPWTPALKWVSLLATVVLCVCSYAAYRAVPVPTGFTHRFGVGVAMIPLLILVGALFFVVRGFPIDKGQLCVARLLSTTRFPLAGLVNVYADAQACKGAWKVAGNGGLFSFTGWFQSKRLGRFRVFVTDFREGVVLEFEDRVLVISPADPQVFIEHLRRAVPGLQAPET